MRAAWSEAAHTNPDSVNIDEFLGLEHPESSHSFLTQRVEELMGKVNIIFFSSGINRTWDDVYYVYILCSRHIVEYAWDTYTRIIYEEQIFCNSIVMNKFITIH